MTQQQEGVGGRVPELPEPGKKVSSLWSTE